MSTRCYNAAGSRPSVALWGDSHSTSLALGVRAQADAAGYGFAQFGKASCLPLTGAADYLLTEPLQAGEYLRFNGKVLDLLNPIARSESSC